MKYNKIEVNQMNYSVIVLCAGSGSRVGLGYNKMLYRYENQTVYEHTMSIFLQDSRCKQIVVVSKEDEREIFQTLLCDSRITYCNGGKERQDSVYEGLQLVNQDYVLIHDGARPFLQIHSIDELLQSLDKHKACLLMVPCKDTIKEVVDGKIVKTLKREVLMQAQTPQAFQSDLIKQVYKIAKEKDFHATDDSQLVEQFSNEDVYCVIGDYNNIKITTKEDLL